MKVLLAEDDPTSRRMLEAVLERWGYLVLSAEDGTRAWEILQAADAPRLAILDWVMPGVDGLELCRRIRAREDSSAPYTYVVLLTSRGSKTDVVAGMDAGADDYVAKPFDQHELQARLRAGRRIVELEEQLRGMQEDLRRQSRSDPLTGILNRRAILEILEAELHRARRDLTPLAISLVDLDRFKVINDTLGHAAGDAALLEFVRRVQESLRSYDSFGRLGGEEFLIVVPGASLECVGSLFSRIQNAMSERAFTLGAASWNLTISQGGAVSGGFEKVEELLGRADRALYRAKAGGRNRVEIDSIQD